MKPEVFLVEFQEFVASCPVETLDDHGRYVFLSDLHMGDGGPRDDLSRNRELLEAALGAWYLKKGFILVLNGDIEDLIKFDLPSIQAAWPRVFELFDAFHQAGRLRKITGNHDLDLVDIKDYAYPLKLGLTLDRNGKRIFVCHGHQASRFYVDYDFISEFFPSAAFTGLPVLWAYLPSQGIPIGHSSNPNPSTTACAGPWKRP